MAALLGFVVLVVLVRLVHDTWRESVTLPAVFTAIRLAQDLRWIKRGCPP